MANQFSNLNRQIIATRDTVGKYKVDVMKERALSINPDIKVNAHKCYYMPDNADEYDFSVYSYIVDAIDTVTGKIEIITRAAGANVPVISCMGAGNKMNAAMLEVADIYELKQRGIKKLKVVYSKEEPIKPLPSDEQTEKRAVPGSTAFVPAAAGLIAAGEVVKDLIKI